MADGTQVTSVVHRPHGVAPRPGSRPAPHLGIEGSPALVLQPAVDLATGRLLGFEALLRWIVPGRGTIMPGALIPWAEANGHMTELNTWVLAEACREAARWRSNLQVAVNCSIFQLQRGDAAAAASAALEESGLNPDRLTVEVSETSVGDAVAAADLSAMTRLGVQLTVDDVRSDLSFLENLQHAAVNTVKIDGALVAGLEAEGQDSSRSVVETIVDLSRSLGICTVAECVETAGQVAILRAQRVDVAQGYFFSAPVSTDEAFALSTMEPPMTYALPDSLPDSLRAADVATEAPAVPAAPMRSRPAPAPAAAPPAPAAAAPAFEGNRVDQLAAAMALANRNLAELAAVVAKQNELLQALLPRI